MNEIELLKTTHELAMIEVRAERDQAITAWKVAQGDIKTFMAENARLLENARVAFTDRDEAQRHLSAIVDAYHDGENLNPLIEAAADAGS